MRRYKIEIDGGATYDSAPNGSPDPGALLVEMDITVAPRDVPTNNAYVRVWGVGIPALSQAKDLFQKKITVSGGMAKGLPLAKPEQYGLLTKGIITKAFGNWVGVDQSLDLFISPDNDPAKPDGGANPVPAQKNIVLNWQKGKKLDDALKSTLQTAFPGMDVNMALTKSIIAPQDQVSYHPTMQQLAYYVRRITQNIVGNNFQGVAIVDNDGKINVSDGHSASGAKQVSFEDLIGQPTWIDPGTIQFKTTMRSDIKVQDQVKLPQTWINSSGSANYIGPNSYQQMAFQGSFQVSNVRHVGNSRQPSGDAWVTIFDAAFLQGNTQ